MGRMVNGWFDELRGVWYARLGSISEKTGKPRPVVLKDAQGRPIPRGTARARTRPFVGSWTSGTARRGRRWRT